MTWVNIRAMTTTSGTPSNQRMIGMRTSIAVSIHQPNRQPLFLDLVPNPQFLS
jgi:hypothetical protein